MTRTLTVSDMMQAQKRGQEKIDAANAWSEQAWEASAESRAAHAMSKQERDAEILRLRDHHKAALATPLMSEGNISPMQAGMFSKNQKAAWQDKAQEKMAVEARIKNLSRSDEELQAEHRAQEVKKAAGEKNQIESYHKTIHGLGPMSHKANGSLKPSYQKQIEIGTARLAALHEQFPELKTD